MPEYERVLAGAIYPGDRVASSRTHPFEEVVEVKRGPKAVSLIGFQRGNGHYLIGQPLKGTKWWRLKAALPDRIWVRADGSALGSYEVSSVADPEGLAAIEPGWTEYVLATLDEQPKSGAR